MFLIARAEGVLYVMAPTKYPNVEIPTPLDRIEVGNISAAQTN